MPLWILKLLPIVGGIIMEVLAVGMGKTFFIKSAVYIIEEFGNKLVKKTDGVADDKALALFLENVKRHYKIK